MQSQEILFFLTINLIILVSIKAFVTADYFQLRFFEISKKKKEQSFTMPLDLLEKAHVVL